MVLIYGLLAAQALTPAGPTNEEGKTAASQSVHLPSEPSEADSGRLGPAQQSNGEIVVTARRRVETVQSVPIAMSVIGGATLSETGAYNVSRLTQLQPTLQFYSTNPRNSAANIRGLGAPFGLTNDGIEQGVGIYIDGVYYSRIASATFDFTDTERIEILRGPQGSLYGKNTTAGAINITTRPPSFTPEARIELSTGNLEFVQAKASASGPIAGERLAARLSASITSRRGTIDNVATGKWVNAQDNQSLRGQLLWKPTDTLRLTLSGDYNRQNPDCCAQIFARVGATQRPISRQYESLAAAFGYEPPSRNAFDRVTDLDTPLRARQELGGTSLVADLDLGAATLTSISAWRFWDWDPSNDRDFIGLPITTVSANPSQQRQVSQEIRVASNGRRTVDYVGGIFYFHQTIDTQGLQVQGPAASRFLLNPGNPPFGTKGCASASSAACDPSVLDGLAARNSIGFSNTSMAAFGKLTWHLNDALSIAPGLRLNHDRKRGSYLSTVTTGAGSTTLDANQRGVLAPQSYNPEFSDWNLSSDITLAYDVTPDVHAYATYARGYKSGGINLSGLPLDASNEPILAVAQVKPEQVNHYELGIKTQFFDRRVTANLAAFWTGIRDYQATVTNGQLGVLRGYLANAEQVRTRGVELDTAFRPNDRLNLYANAAYTDARYVRFVDAPCPPELSGGTIALPGQAASAPGTPGGVSPPFCDVSGQRLPGVSDWAFSYGAEYAFPMRVGAADGNFYLGYDGSYRSDFSSNPSESAYTTIAGYSLSNVRLGYRTRSGLNAFIWARNIFDHDYYELLATQSGNTGLIVGQPGDPRTYGATLSASF